MSTSRVGNDPELVETDHDKATVQTIVRDYVTKLRGGDLGSLPAVLGLVVLFLVFTALKPDRFPSQINVANLTYQAAAIVVLSMGLVFVLLLGEIDLSAGYIGGTSAAVTGVVMTEHGWPWIPSLLACLATGAVIGAVIGLLVARLGIPSFVVTLAFFLGLQGVLLVIIGEGGTIGYENEVILSLNNDPLPVWLGWATGRRGPRGVRGSDVALGQPATHGRSRSPADAPVGDEDASDSVVLVLAFVAYLSGERGPRPELKSIKGVPLVVVIVVGLLVVLTYVLKRTQWGRHIYAVGGNAEAARRAGINVLRVKLTCFIMSWDAGGVRRFAHRQPQQLGVDEHRWRHDPAVRRGCGSDRRHQPVRRQGPCLRRRHRRLRGGDDRQRHGPAAPVDRQRLHDHRPGPPGRCECRRHQPTTGLGFRQGLAP